MINLNKYDIISNKVDKNKTWVDINKQLLLSREIKYHRFYILSKRFNYDTNEYEFFIIMSDNKIPEAINSSTNKDDYGRIKLRINRIFNECGLNLLKEDVNIHIECIDEDEESCSYKLHI